MKAELRNKINFYLFPPVLMLFTRAGIELSVAWIPSKSAWISSFAIYYIFILLIGDFARRKGLYNENTPGFNSPVIKPSFLHFLWGVLLPAVLPLYFFLNNIAGVPLDVLQMIIIVALINPYFEEKFWRKLMSQMPVKNSFKIVYSAFWFSAGHYILWASYWLTEPRVWIPTVATTFIMGICWMSFFLKTGKYKYIVISHMLVDIFNLSAAVFFGIELRTI